MNIEHMTLNGQNFLVRHWGQPESGESKPILLMLHGFPEYGGAWQDLAHHLQGDFHCIGPDQRGYGGSWSPDGVDNYATSKLVADMAALIQKVSAGPVLVLGHDWGSAVAYGLAMFCPHLVDRLIIVNGVHPVPFQRAVGAGGAQTEASQYIRALRREGAEDALAADTYAKLMALFSANMDLSWMTGARKQGYIDAWSAGGGRLKTMLHWYRASPLRVAKPGEPITDMPEFPKDQMMVHRPHLLIWGDADTALLPDCTEGLEDFVPDLTRVTIPGADHWLCHQRPQEVAQAIRDWLAG